MRDQGGRSTSLGAQGEGPCWPETGAPRRTPRCISAAQEHRVPSAEKPRGTSCGCLSRDIVGSSAPCGEVGGQGPREVRMVSRAGQLVLGF